MKKQPKLLIGIIAGVAVLAVVIVSIVMTAAGGSKDTYNSHMELAQRYLEELQYEQAIAEYEAAIEIEPNNPEAYLGMALAYEGLDDIDMAIQTLADAYEKTENEEIKEAWSSAQLGYLDKAQSYEDIDDIDMALQTLEEGLERTGNEQIKDKLIECYLSQAEEYIRNTDYEKALEIFDRLLELDMENLQIQSDVGNCLLKYFELLMEQRFYDEAESLINKYKDKVSGDYVDFKKMLDSIEEHIVLAENSVWVDDLYEKMILGDHEAVFSIITAPNFLEKCSMFICYEEIYYALLTSDGKVVRVEDSSEVSDDYGWISVLYCTHDDDFYDYYKAWPDVIREGDYYYNYSYIIESGDDDYSWLIENNYHNDALVLSDGNLSTGEVYWYTSV